MPLVRKLDESLWEVTSKEIARVTIMDKLAYIPPRIFRYEGYNHSITTVKTLHALRRNISQAFHR